MRNILIIGFILISMFESAISQEIVFPELSGYKKNTDYPVYTPQTLWNFIDGAADNFLTYEFADLHVAEYKKGKNVIKLEIYRHSSNTMAFGIYSSERSPSFRFINLGGQGYVADGAINFFKGNYYIKLRTFSKNEKVLQSEESLALQVSNMLPGDSKLPAVLTQFPENGKKQNEETFVNESVLGHKFLNKAYKAVYEIGADNFSIYIFENNSTEEAKKQVDAYLAAAGVDALDSGSGKYVLKDGYNGNIFLAWKDSKIVIISGLSKDQSEIADQYTSEIIK